jgi:hypothetical protein
MERCKLPIDTIRFDALNNGLLAEDIQDGGLLTYPEVLLAARFHAIGQQPGGCNRDIHIA